MGMTGMNTRMKKVTVALAACSSILGLTIVLLLPSVNAGATFRRYVLCPIPESVKHIEIGRCQRATLWLRLHGWRDQAVVLGFDINREDLLRIVAARGFKLDERSGYADDSHWYSTGGYSARFDDLFRRGRTREAPDWFDLPMWTGAEIYILGSHTSAGARIDVSYLLFNERLGRAFLIWREQGSIS